MTATPGRRASGWLLAARTWGWLLLLALAPLWLFPAAATTPVLMVVPGLLFLYSLGPRRSSTRTPQDGAILVLALMILVSLWATPDLAYSLPKIAGLVGGLGLYYAVWAGFQASARRAGLALVLFLALGGGFAAAALVGTRWPDRIGLLTFITARLPQRLYSLPGAEIGLSYNGVAGVALMIAPLALALAASGLAHRQRVMRWLAAPESRPLTLAGVAATCAALLSLPLIALTQSRGGYLSLAAAVLVMLALALQRDHPRVLMALAALAATGLALVAVIGPARAQLIGLLFSSPEQAARLGSLSNFQWRLDLWAHALYAIQDHPFTGIGLNAFRLVIPRLYPMLNMGSLKNIPHAHDAWLQVALDLGLPGLIAYLALWLNLLGMLGQALRRGLPWWLRAAGIGLAGCLAGYFVYGLTDTVALGAKGGVFFWLLLALGGLIWRQAVPAPGRPAGR